MTAHNQHNDDQEVWLEKARTLSEALPFFREHSGETFVIKYGGHAMGEETLAQLFARDIVLLRHMGIHPVIAHGGGPQIGEMLKRLNIKSEFIDGLRVTDAATMEVVEMVLSGTINKAIVTAINQAGGLAVGLSGKDGGMIRARRIKRFRKGENGEQDQLIDLGLVGEPAEVNPYILRPLQQADIIPVIAPIGVGSAGETYNINGDTAAGAVAAAVGASRLFFLTDVSGVLDKQGNLIPEMTARQARELIADGTIAGGMIPKVETCLKAVEEGVRAAVILDGRVPHALLLELFTPHGAGTLISRDPY